MEAGGERRERESGEKAERRVKVSKKRAKKVSWELGSRGLEGCGARSACESK